MKNWRINLILFFIFLFALVIIGRLVYIQILQDDFYRALAKGQQRFFREIKEERGEIFLIDKNQNRYPLAVNRNWYFVFISPATIREKERNKISQDLSQILNLEKEAILEKTKNENSFFQIIKNRLSREEVEKLKEINLPGVYLRRETLRYYPRGFLASQVIGFVDGSGEGRYGLEGYYNEILRGRPGEQTGIRDVWGRVIRLIGGTDNRKGADLVLTIDYNIQFTAERLLVESYEKWNVKEGTIIVMEPHSGAILALANFPNFNPNYFSEFNDLGIFKNQATQEIFEPGSVFKPIVIAAGLDQNKITPQTVYEDEGFIKIGDRIIRNFARRIWGEQTITQILAKSINTGTVFLQNKIGQELFYEYIRRFGFLEPTKIDLQGEVYSENKHLRPGSPEINFATASFGQGIAITPIQLIRSFAIIANGGRAVKPHLVQKIIDEDGEENKIQPLKPSKQIISPKTASQLTSMLVSAVDHRFLRQAQVPGYYVAGKTGTAEIPWAALGYDKIGYSDKTIHTIVGFAPALDPQFVILVKLNQPQGARTASVSAAPIFRELTEFIINYWQLPPDRM